MAGDVVFNNATVTITVQAINVNGTAEVLQRLDDLAAQIALQGAQEMATLDDLVQAAQDESTVDDSIIALVQELKAAVDAAGGNQAKIDAAFAAVTANKQKIAAAVLANTPQAPGGETPPTT